MRKIYLLTGIVSDYDMQGHWTVGVYLEKEHAELDAKHLQKLADAVAKARAKWKASDYSSRYKERWEWALVKLAEWDPAAGSNNGIQYEGEEASIADAPMIPLDALVRELTQ